ncbi:MAG: hypothetical protein OXG82_08280 [Gammaproteobacteria bacterium]|nr:hypothetical protein [Gammaproteobacteria bacterium]
MAMRRTNKELPMERRQAFRRAGTRAGPLRILIRVGCVFCVGGMLTTSCVSTAHRAPRPLTGDYPAMVVDLMAASAKGPRKQTPAEPATAAVAAWRARAGASPAPAGLLGSTTAN